ncbi:MAG: hypothetical protein AAF664_14075 [Planctomycetota bacterium]
MKRNQRSEWRARCVGLVVVLVATWSYALGFDRVAFRDASHFYGPTYSWMARQSEWFPLWNDRVGWGQPLAGETTPAVFYPVRLLVYSAMMPWIDPITDDHWPLNVYMVIHLMIASWAMYSLVRRLGGTVAGAIIASIAYPMSGSVVFLMTNPPFLVGAAWLPVWADRILEVPHRIEGPSGRTRRVIWIGIAIAASILGGDPQTVAQFMLLAVAIHFFRYLKYRRLDQIPFLSVCSGLLLAVALSAPQCLTSFAFAIQSDRATMDERTFLTTPPIGSHAAEARQFSIPPWHWIQLVSPAASGSHMPLNRRWMSALPAEPKMWTPSVYVGVGVLVLAVGAAVSNRRWAILGLSAVMMSAGVFGPVWYARWFFGFGDGIDDAVGGPWWLIHGFIPVFDAFRYPAKYAVFVSLALAAMAGCAFSDERIVLGKRAALICFGLIGILGLLSFMIGEQTHVDRWYGPLDWKGAMLELRVSLIVSATLLVVWFGVCRFVLNPRIRSTTLVAVTALEFILFAAWALPEAPSSQVQAMVMARGQTPLSSDRRYLRTSIGNDFPERWKLLSSSMRSVDVEAEQIATKFGRYHLHDNAAVFNSITTMRFSDVDAFWESLPERKRGYSNSDDLWREVGIDSVFYRSEGGSLVERALVKKPLLSKAVAPSRPVGFMFAVVLSLVGWSACLVWIGRHSLAARQHSIG